MRPGSHPPRPRPCACSRSDGGHHSARSIRDLRQADRNRRVTEPLDTVRFGSGYESRRTLSTQRIVGLPGAAPNGVESSRDARRKVRHDVQPGHGLSQGGLVQQVDLDVLRTEAGQSGRIEMPSLIGAQQQNPRGLGRIRVREKRRQKWLRPTTRRTWE